MIDYTDCLFHRGAMDPKAKIFNLTELFRAQLDRIFKAAII